ncbi:hypothetical protein PR048_019290 [Dryococelus australis]|uniref:Integrase catalytic domain-containing protein n=1 Tax=Dryococelus australis TaxID=614101 RepID=A0ABQ9H355_9NEOP|nr:hypothetical protein PR048_019290 [Dryococelus australis]
MLTILIDVADEVPWYCTILEDIQDGCMDLKFREKCQADTFKSLSVEELDLAEKLPMKMVQHNVFTIKRHADLKSINIVKGEKHIIRVRTKITPRTYGEGFLHLMLLPSKHKLTELIILEEHILLSWNHTHKPEKRILAIEREENSEKVIAHCIPCRRHRTQRIVRAPVTLPEDRVKEAAVFDVTGVELTRPLVLKVIFTCAVDHCIHLELIEYLSTKLFLFALRKFISCKGRPKIIYSDNGTNFGGGGGEQSFAQYKQKNVETEVAVTQIQWKFNPPTEAWWGEWWEQLIQMMKKLLRRILGCAVLRYEELLTVICECQAVINFMEVPEPDQADLNKRRLYQQRLRADIRSRFRAEYLSQLLQRPKKAGQHEIKSGEIVFPENEKQGRIFWLFARLVEVYPAF